MIQRCYIPGKLMTHNEAINALKAGSRWRSEYHRQKQQLNLSISIIAKKCMQPVTMPVHIKFWWIAANKRTDPDNIVSAKKFVLDGLVHGGILQGDGWKHIAGFTDTWGVGREPGVYVTLIGIRS